MKIFFKKLIVASLFFYSGLQKAVFFSQTIAAHFLERDMIMTPFNYVLNGLTTLGIDVTGQEDGILELCFAFSKKPNLLIDVLHPGSCKKYDIGSRLIAQLFVDYNQAILERAEDIKKENKFFCRNSCYKPLPLHFNEKKEIEKRAAEEMMERKEIEKRAAEEMMERYARIITIRMLKEANRQQGSITEIE